MQYICNFFVEMHKNSELNCDFVPNFAIGDKSAQIN